MFGSLVSATDPVAVVALLKELGMSPKLGTLIEGESLLNDGTAYVLFIAFKDRSTGTKVRDELEILGIVAAIGVINFLNKKFGKVLTLH